MPSLNNATRSFIPISLGNHFYSKSVLRFVKEQVIDQSHDSKVVICDYLRCLNYQMRGVAAGKGLCMKVELEADQFRRTLNNAGISNSDCTIVTMTRILKTPGFKEILVKLSDYASSIDVEPTLKQLACDYLYRFNIATNDVKLVDLQKLYLIYEAALCIHITESLGYTTEVYRIEDMVFTRYLYTHHERFLCSIVAKRSLERQFLSIETMIDEWDRGQKQASQFKTEFPS
ncbi:MAG: hypothetical protein AAFY29_01585 [Pseudomonadota bacterium]